MDNFTADVLSAFQEAATGAKATRENVISFPDWQMMHKVLTPKRMDILMAMTGAGEMSIRKIAALVGRDVKSVHTDVTALISNGLLEKASAERHSRMTTSTLILRWARRRNFSYIPCRHSGGASHSTKSRLNNHNGLKHSYG